MGKKPTAIVICPGRGTYNASELGYLHRYHGDKFEFLALVDAVRERRNQVSISELDCATQYKMSAHGTGDNASLLIFACAVADFLDVQDEYEIVAVTGNSMGWYLALTCAGALSLESGATLVNEMGILMHEQGRGGQIVYPVVDDDWRTDPSKMALVEEVMREAGTLDDIHISVSIRLGGMIVFAADKGGLALLQERLPQIDRFPMLLKNHAAFHSSLLNHVVSEAKKRNPIDLFQRPAIPMVDGRGHIWSPYGADLQALHEYTLDTQITETYDFSRAVEISVKEFAPDTVIVTGPGSTMGPPVAQELIRHSWRGISGKSGFKALQAAAPYIIGMGLPEQRATALGN